MKTIKALYNARFRREGTSRGEADGALQSLLPAPNIPNPLVSVDGLNNADNGVAFGFQVLPPDTNGDVGPNHYVQATNLLVRVFNKSGAPVSAAFKLSSLFAPIGGECADVDDGDPVVLYDPLADRWLLSQFGVDGPPFHECIAISKSGDPTGQYYIYDFITPGNQFPDYPKLGVWPDAYYMSTVQFLNGVSYDGAGIFAFDRAKMLAGHPTPAMIYVNKNLASDADPGGLGGILPSDFDGLTPPPLGRPNTFVYFTANEYGGADGLRLFDFHPDFHVPPNSTFTERPESTFAAPLAVAPFDPTDPPGSDDIQQPGSTPTSALDAIGDRLMFRLQYRNSGAAEWLVVSHTVGAPASTTLGTYRAGVRYYQLTRNVGGGPYSVLEQATFAPVDGLNRWMPSAATDYQGNLAVGYSTSSSASFPSLRYAGRLAGDPPGGLAQGENTLVAGAGSQTHTASRWGDYSMLAVDPVDDCTFWFTSEYYAATSSLDWRTRIGSFKFTQCVSAPRGTLQGMVTNATTTAGLVGATVRISNGFSQTTVAAGNYVRVLAPGTYTLVFSAPGFVPAAVNGVVISNGGTAVVNQALVPAADLAAAGSSLVAESIPNGRLDAGETVTVSLCLANNGLATSGTVNATLLEAGGVLTPSGGQSYGTVAPAGSACRTYSFVVGGACGSSVTGTLQVQESGGLTKSLTYSLPVGSVANLFSQNFDGVVAPAFPAGWSSAQIGGVVANPWVTNTTTPDTPPNRAFAGDPNNISDNVLISPAIALAAGPSSLTFRNHYNVETGFDGGVLEISINGGGFADIITAGGSFVAGGYTGAISSSFGSPIGGRQAWTGNSTGFITSTVNMPPAAGGQNVVLRWRMASDDSVSATGWAVDTVSISQNVCSNQAPVITTHPQSQTVMSGTTTTLTVVAAGSAPLGYQWYLGTSGDTSNPIGGATSASYTTPVLVSPQNYWVRVSNAFGPANSTTAVITIGPGAGVNLLTNGDFSAGTAGWNFFEEPDIVYNVTGGVLNFYRANPTTTPSGQAAAFQVTGQSMASPLRAQFDLANTSTARKRISVLIIDGDFSDIAFCTFWLAAGAPMRTYTMRTHTTKPWASTAIYFYAATKGQDGGFYQLDNVSVRYDPTVSSTRTDCVDPTAPAPPGGSPGGNLLANSDFPTNSLTPWAEFGSISWQVADGVFEFIRPQPLPTPAGVIFQNTGQPMAAGQILTATLQLGNSSNVRKRATILLHESDFSDILACTFWLAPNRPLGPFAIRAYTTKAWVNATVSIYNASVGSQTWTRVDDVTLERTPGTAIVGTECLEPPQGFGPEGQPDRTDSGGKAGTSSGTIAAPGGGGSVSGSWRGAGTEGAGRDWSGTTGFERELGRNGTPGSRFRAIRHGAGRDVLYRTDPIDLTGATGATLTFASMLTGGATSGAIQASTDGITWQTAANVPAGREVMAIDLSSFAGHVVYIRFVFTTSGPMDAPQPDLWTIEDVMLNIRGVPAPAGSKPGPRKSR